MFRFSLARSFSTSFPKRPTTAFAYFMKDVSVGQKANFKELSAKWKSLSEEEKAPYFKMHKENMEKFRAEIEALSPEQREEMKNKTRTERMMKTLSSKTTKAAIRGSNLFMKERYEEFKQANPGLDHREMLSLISKQWSQLPAEQKEEYSNRAQQIREERKAQLEKKFLQIEQDKKITSYRPPTAFFIYLAEQKDRLVAEITAQQPDLPKKEQILLWSKKAAQEWTQLTDEQKQPYFEKYQKLKEEHANDPRVLEARTRLQEEEEEFGGLIKKKRSRRRKTDEEEDEDEVIEEEEEL